MLIIYMCNSLHC